MPLPVVPFKGSQRFEEAHQADENLLELLPCVIYNCTASLHVTYLSPNANKLLGIKAQSLLGNRLLWQERFLPEDLTSLCEKINKLEGDETVSSIHRIIDDRGLPVWVSHSFRRVQTRSSEIISGCIVPLAGEKRLQNLDRGIDSRFVHKIGNHFQLLNLLVNSLRRQLPESRETEVLRQTVEKAIELTRAFSDYSQGPTWFSEVELAELLNGAVVTRKASYSRKGVRLEVRIDESVRGVTIEGDPFSLESAIGSVLQNALEATENGGSVVLEAGVDAGNDRNPPVTRVRVIDSGCGIKEQDLSNVTVPFYTSKKNHDGLGLSMASRFIELHGGILRIDSLEGKGTKVEMTLPTNIGSGPVER